MLEKDLENLIAQHPDEFFPNSRFKLIGQQVKLGKCFADIIFEDKYQRKIIIEVKKGTLSRDASGQVMEYYGLLKSQSPNDTIEIILCANTIPQERKMFLETAGIECKEIGINKIIQIAEKVGYEFISTENFKKVEISDTISTEETIWIFQGSQLKYKIIEMLNDKKVSNEFTWRVKQYKRNISIGHIGLIWISGEKAGIYAVSEILSDPDNFVETDAEKEYRIDSTTDEEGSLLRVKMKLKKNLTNNPIIKETIKNKNGLQNLSVLKQPWAGTNFKVTSDEWKLIKELIDQ